MCAQQSYSMAVIMQNKQEKADLQKMKVNAMKIRKGRVDRNKLCTGAIYPVVYAVGRLLWTVSVTKYYQVSKI